MSLSSWLFSRTFFVDTILYSLFFPCWIGLNLEFQSLIENFLLHLNIMVCPYFPMYISTINFIHFYVSYQILLTNKINNENKMTIFIFVAIKRKFLYWKYFDQYIIFTLNQKFNPGKPTKQNQALHFFLSSTINGYNTPKAFSFQIMFYSRKTFLLRRWIHGRNLALLKEI